MPAAPPPADWNVARPWPRPFIAMRGALEPAATSSGTGGSKVEPSIRRAIAREAPPMSWRNTAHTNEPSSSMSMSGESAVPPAAPPMSGTEICCGAADGLRPVTRRA